MEHVLCKDFNSDDMCIVFDLVEVNVPLMFSGTAGFPAYRD